jgi:uncharacterized damage-inducible protein DinB
MSRIIRILQENVQPRKGRRGWHGGPTALGALRGVSAEQARWRPGPRRKSIWDLALHIAYWNYAVRRRLENGSRDRTAARFDRAPSNWPKPRGAPDNQAWAADVALVRAEHEKLLTAIGAVTPAELDRKPQGRGEWSYAELVLGIALHDAYHIGQIQLTKRLWAERNAH